MCDVTQANVERLQALSNQNAPILDNALEDRLEDEGGDDNMDLLKYGSLPPGANQDDISPRFRRTGSERLRDGAKAFLRRMESLKSKRRKRHNRDEVVISGPQVLDVTLMQQKMKDLNCVDVSPTGPAPISFADPSLLVPPMVSPMTLSTSPLQPPVSPSTNAPSPFGDDSSSYCSDGSQGGGPTPTPTRTKLNRARRLLHRSREDQGAFSDSECQPTSWKHRYFKDANSNNTKVLEFVSTQVTTPKESNRVSSLKSPTRGGSLNLGKDSQKFRDKLQDDKGTIKREERLYKSMRHSKEDSRPLPRDVTVYREKTRRDLTESPESSSTVASKDSDQEEESPKQKGTAVVRWVVILDRICIFAV